MPPRGRVLPRTKGARKAPRQAAKAGATGPTRGKASVSCPRRASRRHHWLVTGGTGFLGRRFVERMLAEGHRVRSLDLAPAPPHWKGEKRLDVATGDIRHPAAVAAAMKGVDRVLHAAAALPILRDRREILSVNVDGTRNLLAAAEKQGVEAFVFTSTTAVYGLHKEHPITEGSPIVPVGPYGESKVAAEAVCHEFRDQGMHVAVIRPKTFLGPGRLGVFEILLDWVRDGKRIPLIGKGTNRYQLLDVDDLVEGIVRAAEHPKGSDTFNMAAIEFGTLRDDLAPLFEAAGHPPRFLPLPRRTVKAALWTLDQAHLSPLTKWHYGTMDQDSYVEVAKAQRVLGWQPKRGNRETLLAAYEWYHEHRDEFAGRTGTGHTVPWDQRILKVFKRFA